MTGNSIMIDDYLHIIPGEKELHNREREAKGPVGARDLL